MRIPTSPHLSNRKETATVSLSSTLALDFAAPNGIGDGIKDQEARFSGSLSRVNSAVETITVSAPPHFDGNVSFTVNDQGEQGLGGSLEDLHTVGLNLRAGSIPNLVAVDPPSAPIDGGKIASVTGNNFDADNLECLWGSNLTTIATKISSNQVHCLIPPHGVGLIPLYIRTGVGFLSNKLQFTYEISPFIAKVYPTNGPINGGTRIVVSGENMRSSDKLSCQLGDKVVKAKYISSSAIECNTPPSAKAGSVLLRISNNGHHFSSSSQQFSYYAPAVVNAISPSIGPSIGKTRIFLRALNLMNSSSLSCKFGKTTTKAVFISQTRCTCISPPYKISSGVLPRTVSIQISNNGIDFVSSSRTFTYLYQVSVTSISPKHGALEGGTRVIVRGSHFVNNEVLACKFGDIVVAASFVTTSELVCLSPSHNVGRVAVEVSTNRVDYSGNGVLYTFKMQSSVSFIEPRLGPKSGGTLVTVHGNNFIQGTNFYCRFGETSRGVVKGTWLATSLIQCISPPSSHPSTKAVYVSTNLVDFTRKSVKAFFVHTRELELKSLAPTNGPAFGGTNVSIFGENFYPLPSGAILRCRFGQKVVAAYIVTPYQLACVTPTFRWQIM